MAAFIAIETDYLRGQLNNNRMKAIFVMLHPVIAEHSTIDTKVEGVNHFQSFLILAVTDRPTETDD